MATACVESRDTKTASIPSWDGINELDSSLYLTDLEADWGRSAESFDAFALDCLVNIPPEEAQLPKTTLTHALLSHIDESSREGLSALPESGSWASSDDFQQIDHRFATSDASSLSCADQKRQFCPPRGASYTV